MSSLIYDTIDLNKAEVVKKLLGVVQACINISLARYSPSQFLIAVGISRSLSIVTTL